MKIIVGLGNPGPKYKLTRHNVGFMVIDACIDHYRSAVNKEEHQSLITRVKISAEDVLLVKPQTFMNLSGQAVQALVSFYKLSLDDILVIHDDVDLSFGRFKIQRNRGHGGQNGVRDIHSKIGPDYSRLKFGVGRPTIPQIDVATHVLQNFSEEEQNTLPDRIHLCINAIECFVIEGYKVAQNRFNS